LDGIRAQIEAGISEFSQDILVVCSRKFRKIRADWGDEDRQVAKSDRLLAKRMPAGAGMGLAEVVWMGDIV